MLIGIVIILMLWLLGGSGWGRGFEHKYDQASRHAVQENAGQDIQVEGAQEFATVPQVCILAFLRSFSINRVVQGCLQLLREDFEQVVTASSLTGIWEAPGDSQKEPDYKDHAHGPLKQDNEHFEAIKFGYPRLCTVESHGDEYRIVEYGPEAHDEPNMKDTCHVKWIVFGDFET